jgi:hypothetical protein
VAAREKTKKRRDMVGLETATLLAPANVLAAGAKSKMAPDREMLHA